VEFEFECLDREREIDRERERERMKETWLPGSKKAKFGHKQFPNKPNPQNKKRPNFLCKVVKMTRFKIRIS